MNGLGPVHVNAHDPGRGDRTLVIQEKYHPHSASDTAHFQIAILIQGTLQVRGHGLGTVIGMAGNADRVPTEAFNLNNDGSWSLHRSRNLAADS